MANKNLRNKRLHISDADINIRRCEVGRLKDRIDELGIKQSWLAKQLDVAEPTLSRWVTGHVPVPDEHLPHLAKLLHCEPEDIRNGAPKKRGRKPKESQCDHRQTSGRAEPPVLHMDWRSRWLTVMDEYVARKILVRELKALGDDPTPAQVAEVAQRLQLPLRELFISGDFDQVIAAAGPQRTVKWREETPKQPTRKK